MAENTSEEKLDTPARPKLKLVLPPAKSTSIKDNLSFNTKTGVKGNTTESVVGDSTFNDFSYEEQVEYLRGQVEALARGFSFETISKMFTSNVHPALAGLNLDTELANIKKSVSKGGEVLLPNLLGRQIITFITKSAFPTAGYVGRDLLQRIVETDFPVEVELQRLDGRLVNYREQEGTLMDLMSELSIKTAVPPDKEVIVGESRHNAQLSLAELRPELEKQLQEFISIHVEPGDTLALHDAEVVFDEQWAHIEASSLEDARDSAEVEYVKAKGEYDAAKVQLARAARDKEAINKEIAKLTVQSVILNGLMMASSKIISIVRGAVNTHATVLISTLNKSYQIRTSGRTGSMAFLQNDLSALLHVLKETYQEASLPTLSREIHSLLALKQTTPLGLNGAIIEIFEHIRFSDVWKYMCPEVLHAIVLIKGVAAMNEDLGRKLNDIQLEYFKKVQALDKGTGGIVQAMKDLEDQGVSPLPVQLQAYLETYNESQRYTASDSTESRRPSKATSPGTADAHAYVGITSGDGSESSSAEFSVANLAARLSKLESNRQDPPGGTRKAALAAAATMQYFEIRKGTYPTGTGSWTGVVKATREKADLPKDREWTNPSGAHPLYLMYLPTDSTFKSTARPEYKMYVAQKAKSDNERGMACHHCGLVGHKSYGCLQKGSSA